VKALVLGATGRIGNAIVRELLHHGAAVTAVSRHAAPADNLADLAVDYRAGDADRPGQIEAWVAGHDLVVDAAAPYHLWLFEDEPAAERLAKAGARLPVLLTCVVRHGVALAFIGSFASTPRVRPLFGRAQASVLRLLHPYFELKRRMEDAIGRAVRDGGRAMIVSPTFCIGPGDIADPARAFIPMVVKGTIPATNAHAMNVIDVRDVAALVVAAVAADAFGGRIPVVGHNCTLDMLVDLIARATGAPRPRWHVPSSLAAAAAYANEVVNASGVRDADHPSLGMLLMLEQTWESPSAQQRRLGVPLRPLSRSIADALDWYAGRGALSS